ncbi:MAG: bifunctional UDP-N-acetylglucosamine diphosphorylase/glucosamine-1-phosphate N-acetyltransferase GlmU, partial [Actinomycetota bacterium]
AVVLGAGEGKRLKSNLPKVLHRVGGRALLAHVLAALSGLNLAIFVVASVRKDEVAAAMAAVGFTDIDYVIQEVPRGTADAARIALEVVPAGIETVLVVPGDTPLVTGDTFTRLLDSHSRTEAVATVLTARVDDPSGYGRVIRGDSGDVRSIVEHRDASDQERDIDEINTSVYVFDRDRLSAMLPKIGQENVQDEYYLTDVIGLMVAEGDKVVAVEGSAEEARGVNSRSDLSAAGGSLRRRVAERWMSEGVTIVDPDTTYIDASVTIERDAVIRPFTFLEGDTTIGAHADIGPHARIVDSQVAEDASITYAVVRGSRIGAEASVGPFASIRPGTILGRKARVGTFVETKETTIGDGSKANHLAYLGDAEIGTGVNVGAGTITCNWDGTEKHKTVIEDDAYIGSDTMLVAPTNIGKRAATGAGSVVKGDVPDDALAVGVPARIIEGKGDRMRRKPDKRAEDAGG